MPPFSRLGGINSLSFNKSNNIDGLVPLEEMAAKHGIVLAGRIPYDRDVTRAQIARKTVVEASDGPAARSIRQVWSVIEEQLRLCAASQTSGLVQIVNPKDKQTLALKP